MTADRAWIERNLGFDPIARPAPETTFAVIAAAAKAPNMEDLQREIIDFDSSAPAGMQFLAFTLWPAKVRPADCLRPMCWW